MPQEYEYFAILTNKGTEKMATYLQSGKKIEIAFVAVGDGNGQIPMPDPARTALVNEVWRGPAQTVLDQANKNVIKSTSVIPTDVGGWNVREIGLIDGDGDLFAIANAPGYPKISIADGINNDMQVGMRVAVSNRDSIIVTVDGTVIIATMQDVKNHDDDTNAHNKHFVNMVLHVSDKDRENWDNPLLVATVSLSKSGWSRDPAGVTYIQDVTAQLPPETVLANMDLAIKADPNLIAQMVDGNIGLVAEQSKGKIIFHALREIPAISMYAQVSLYRSKSGKAKTYYSNLLGNPGTIGTPLPLPIEQTSIKLSNASTNTQLKIQGTHKNPTLDWAATRIVRGENAAPVGPSDGVQIADGKITSFIDTNNLRAGVRYIYAYFPRNAAGNYQMSATTAEITIPTQQPLNPTSVSVQDTTDKNNFAATLAIKLPTDVYRDHIAIVRKEGSAPANINDGRMIYSGKDTTVRDTISTNYGIDYHWAVYAVNAEGTACAAPARANLSLKPITPEQVTQTSAADASAPEYGYRVLVKTKIPADVNAYKIMVRRKAGEMPATSIDGDLAYEGSSDTFYDLPPYSSQAYHYRVFTVNQTGQLNDKQEGAIASVTLTAREPGAVTNLSASDTKGTTTGSFDLPVVTVAGREAVNRFVTGYVVIQKEGGTPTTERDGEVIASGTIDPQTSGKTVEFTKVGQKNGADLYITVFLKNAAGSYFWSSGQVVQITPHVLPDAYEFLTCLTQNTEWTPPEDGFYRVTCIGASAAGTGGGSGHSWNEDCGVVGHATGSNHKRCFAGGDGGNGGGAGGLARSVLDLKTAGTIHCTVSNTVSSFGNFLSATSGKGTSGGAGSGGTDFNTIGGNGGSGGNRGSGRYTSCGSPGKSLDNPITGTQGGNNGAKGGSVYYQSFDSGNMSSIMSNIPKVGGGGGGGGGAYVLPSDIAYDDPLRTTYITIGLSGYSGGNGAGNTNIKALPGSSYPAFSATKPKWFGGGNGGGGGSPWDTSIKNGASGSSGSPGGILIEKGVFN